MGSTGGRRAVGPDDPRGLFQPRWVYDSAIDTLDIYKNYFTYFSCHFLEGEVKQP